jgi:hypothetical protein
LDFADSLAFPQIGEAIRVGTPLSGISTWRNNANRLRHFDRLPRWPGGFVTLGDAVCSFNPVYGQGMSVAGLEALDLRSELATERSQPDGVHGLGSRFQKRLAATIDQAWTSACRSDYGVDGAEGDAPDDFVERFAYVQRVVAIARDDHSIFDRVSLTNQLLLTESWFDEPDIRARVLENWDELGAMMGRTDPKPVG